MCKTIAGNACDLVTICSKGENQNTNKVIILTARVHPGETVSSFKIQGIIDFLISADTQAQILRDNFIFKIIPMLNPDGVINGNYRCSLAGCDLNRRWKQPKEELQPTIYKAKRLILHYFDRLGLYCDFHGHSKKLNSFIYGCHDRENPYASWEFPYIMEKVCSSFSFNDCK